MYNNRSKGFTLIELLVVIAIIGILSAVVLASLNTARQKGNDAAVQSNLNTVQTQAEIYYGNQSPQSYGVTASTCSTPSSMFVGDTTISNALAQATNVSGSANVACFSTGSQYAVSAKLSTGKYWCVDSTGFAGQRVGAATASSCPTS